MLTKNEVENRVSGNGNINDVTPSALMPSQPSMSSAEGLRYALKINSKDSDMTDIRSS